MRADDVSVAERERFAAWLAVSSLHAEAWDAVQELFAELEAPAKVVRQRANELGREDTANSAAKDLVENNFPISTEQDFSVRLSIDHPLVVELVEGCTEKSDPTSHQSVHASTSSRQLLHALPYLLHPCSRARTVWWATVIPGSYLRLNPKCSRRWHGARVSLAVAACAGLIGVLLQSALLQNLQSDYHTATGEQRRIELADGSRVLLNTDTALSIDMTADRRTVKLLRGEAFFEVAHAPQRPFWVEAGEARARVTGTAFSVNRNFDTVAITVAEGRVETSSESHAEQITPLTPGESAHYLGAQLSAKQTADVQRELAWRQGQMVFVQAPLADVVAQINRYRPGRLIVTDKQLENSPITAVFNVDKLDDAVTALEQTFGIRARRLTDYWVLLG